MISTIQPIYMRLSKNYKASIVFLCLVFQITTAQDRDYHPAKNPGRIILSWEKDPATSRTITWWTDTTILQAQVQWLISDASSDLPAKATSTHGRTVKATAGGKTAHFHSAHLVDLDPNTVYAYRVGVEGHWSEWFQFKTIDRQALGFNFLYLGDAQNDMRSLWARTIRQAHTQHPQASFVLHLGDMVDHADNPGEWGEWFEAGGWIMASVPQVLVAGNHEYVRDPSSQDGTRLSEYWRHTFTLPLNGPPGLGETAYYFDYKNVRFIVLDSRDMLISEDHSQRQADWLEKLLANNPQKWTIVSHHHPIYSSRGNRKGYSIAEYLQPLYDKYKVDLVLQGHHHSFARGRAFEEVGQAEHQGPVYYVSNSGPKMYDTNFAGWIERTAINVQLYHNVEVAGDRLTVETYLVNGTLYDQIELRKKPNGSKLFREIPLERTEERLDFPRATYGADIDTSQEYKSTFKKRAFEYMKKRGLQE